MPTIFSRRPRRALRAAILATLAAPATTLGQGPRDIAAFCAEAHQASALRQECARAEEAARARVADKVRALHGAPRESWAHCEHVHASWQVVELCLDAVEVGRQHSAVAPTAPTPGAQQTLPTPGAMGAPGTTTESEGTPRAPGATDSTEVTSATPPPAATAPQMPVESSPGVKVWGPEAAPTAATAEADRPSRPISDEEADRRLKAVLERSGARDAVCTKKQYGPGWATVCEGGQDQPRVE